MCCTPPYSPLCIAYLLPWLYRSIVIHNLSQTSPKAGYRQPISIASYQGRSQEGLGPLKIILSRALAAVQKFFYGAQTVLATPLRLI